MPLTSDINVFSKILTLVDKMVSSIALFIHLFTVSRANPSKNLLVIEALGSQRVQNTFFFKQMLIFTRMGSSNR